MTRQQIKAKIAHLSDKITRDIAETQKDREEIWELQDMLHQKNIKKDRKITWEDVWVEKM